MAGCVVHVCCSVLDACCMSLVLCARFGCMVPGVSVLDVLLSAGRLQTVMCDWSLVVVFFSEEELILVSACGLLYFLLCCSSVALE